MGFHVESTFPATKPGYYNNPLQLESCKDLIKTLNFYFASTTFQLLSVSLETISSCLVSVFMRQTNSSSRNKENKGFCGCSLIWKGKRKLPLQNNKMKKKKKCVCFTAAVEVIGHRQLHWPLSLSNLGQMHPATACSGTIAAQTKRVNYCLAKDIY